MSVIPVYFQDMNELESVSFQILARIRKEGRGTVWTAQHFAGLGSATAVQHALARLARKGSLKRIGTGLYAYPEISRLVGTVPPEPEAIARAAARARGHRIAPTGVAALHRLGLSTQVPARNVFLTSGPTRRIQAAGMSIELRHASERRMAGGGEPPGLVLRALEALGPGQITESTINRLSRTLTAADAAKLVRAARQSAAWMRPVAGRIAETAAAR